jgi:hypothetical protein
LLDFYIKVRFFIWQAHRVRFGPATFTRALIRGFFPASIHLKKQMSSTILISHDAILFTLKLSCRQSKDWEDKATRACVNGMLRNQDLIEALPSQKRERNGRWRPIELSSAHPFTVCLSTLLHLLLVKLMSTQIWNIHVN